MTQSASWIDLSASSSTSLLLPPGDTVVLQVVGGAVLGPLHVQSQAEPVEVVLRRRDGVLVDHRGYTLCHIVEFVD